jgi:hypothetical protein
MGVIEYYIIFALATAIAGCYEFLLPLINEAKAAGVTNSLTTNKWLSCFVYIMISTIVAPFLIIPVLFPGPAKNFREGLAKIVFEEDLE